MRKHSFSPTKKNKINIKAKKQRLDFLLLSSVQTLLHQHPMGLYTFSSFPAFAVVRAVVCSTILCIFSMTEII